MPVFEQGSDPSPESRSGGHKDYECNKETPQMRRRRVLAAMRSTDGRRSRAAADRTPASSSAPTMKTAEFQSR
eukprot:6211287-Pleurochrysis_carterae.AAC.1